ncbi:MAG TPA: hypothetical protein VF553_19650 [Pyrinomonadaceae bacterium]
MMDNQVSARSKSLFSEKIVSRYTYAYFDHLQSEYHRIALTMEDEKSRKIKERLAPIIKRREDRELSWDDVYTFDLETLDLLSDEDLVRKAYDMRSKYRSIAGARDYDAYIASKPPDLTTLQLESIRKDGEKASVATEVLRADVRYLLGQFYLHYSLMPLREELRDELTRRARKWTLIFMGFFGLLAILSLILIGRLQATVGGVVSSTVGVVVFAGIMGGCVSMLQRIQSAPNEGDALYNLAALSHGWKGISLSPLYGAIFAMLLYVLFTADILQGVVFPRIVTLNAASSSTNMGHASTQGQSANTPPAHEPSAAVANTASSSAASDPSSSPTPAPAPTPAAKSLPFADTGPVDGKAYALLVIWSFIAGFAERLVPDTLNRLVTKNQSIQGTTT